MFFPEISTSVSQGKRKNMKYKLNKKLILVVKWKNMLRLH